LHAVFAQQFEKKPYNPVLGEVHRCWTLNTDAGKVTYVGEQVSHHPPGMHARDEWVLLISLPVLVR
jgi:Oxysterol-binding protein